MSIFELIFKHESGFFNNFGLVSGPLPIHKTEGCDPSDRLPQNFASSQNLPNQMTWGR